MYRILENLDMSVSLKSPEQIQLLNARLADALMLATHSKQAHWNIRGIGFSGLHPLCDKIFEAAQEYADLLGERIVQLEGIANPDFKKTSLPEYAASNSTVEQDHILALERSLSTFARLCRESIKHFDTLSDQVTSDIFIEITRGADKWRWMVGAHHK
jgi:starvation-inducible DNA-binding protein